MENVRCDLCNADDYQILFQQGDLLHKVTTKTFQMVTCNKCGLHYINPRPTEREITHYYPNKYSFHISQNKLIKITRNMLKTLINNSYFNGSSLFSKILSRIVISPLHLPKIKKKLPYLLVPYFKSYLDINNPKRILDIGCGSGYTTHIFGTKEAIVNLARKGWDVYGIEPSNEARQILKKNGINNVYPNLHNAEFQNDFFDVIRLYWSLEHVHSPTLCLKECKRILNKDGKLILGVPNYTGITYKIFPECVEIPIHLYYFDIDTIQQYCKKINLKILDYYTFSYLPLFLTSLKLMGHLSIYEFIMNNISEAVKLQTFLNLMGNLNLGDDAVFLLSKEFI